MSLERIASSGASRAGSRTGRNSFSEKARRTKETNCASSEQGSRLLISGKALPLAAKAGSVDG
jgi:hypothetical protein